MNRATLEQQQQQQQQAAHQQQQQVFDNIFLSDFLNFYLNLLLKDYVQFYHQICFGIDPVFGSYILPPTVAT